MNDLTIKEQQEKTWYLLLWIINFDRTVEDVIQTAYIETTSQNLPIIENEAVLIVMLIFQSTQPGHKAILWQRR